jgi:diadenosine tetraphosphate (Ap4A) HIT family hydrolase
MTQQFVNTKNVENHPDDKYNSVITNIQKDGVCPFCPDQLKKYHKNPILEETENWLVTNNMYPYKNSKHHILLIHKKHIENVRELGVEEWKELYEIFARAIERSKIPGGTLFMRFGNTRFTGASVSHLHAHLVSSDPDNPEYTALLTRIG